METPIISDRIYISGPITGLEREQYTRRFMLAEQLLRENGYRNIVNPARMWPARFPWIYRVLGYKLTLFIDLWILTRCHRVYKIPGWRQSRGAQIESCIAFHFGVYTIAKPIREILDMAINEQDKEYNQQLPVEDDKTK